MKLGNLCYGQVKISQSLHGAQQGGMAIDCYGSEKGKELDFKAVENGTAERPYDQGTKFEGFWFKLDSGNYAQYTHVKYPGNKHFNKGDFIGHSAWNHCHFAIQCQNWYPYWNYSDQTEVVFTSESGQVYPYKDLPKYQDMDILTCQLVVNNTSMRITGSFNSVSNASKWNIRTEPNSSSAIIGTLIPNTTWTAPEIEINGELANATTVWLRYQAGWVNGGCLVSCVASGDTQCQVELAAAKLEVSQLQKEVDSYKPLTFYTKQA